MTREVLILAVVIGSMSALYFRERCSYWAWCVNVWLNRRRHVDLLKESDGKNNDPVLIAQSMMMRDRELYRRERLEHVIRYPDMWDYLMPHSIRVYRIAKRRRMARERDLRRVREELAAIRNGSAREPERHIV